MISGHRRLHAAGIVGLQKIPAIVKEMSDDEAIIKMVDANIQREEILPSERAYSFKMKMEAMARQGFRTDLRCGTEFHTKSVDERKTRQIILLKLRYRRQKLIRKITGPLIVILFQSRSRRVSQNRKLL